MRHRRVERSGRCVLVIDDDEQVLGATSRLLEREGHDVVLARGAAEGLDAVRRRKVDLVLVDYFMPQMTGEDFVERLRSFDKHTQVIMQTGYASERPPREMLRRLEIQGYHDKSEGPDKLCLWVDVGLRAAFTVQLLAKSRAGLAYILDATPELHKIQPLEQLLQGVLTQTAGLLGVADSLLAVTAVAPSNPDSFVAMSQPGGSLRIRAATGRFVGCDTLANAFGAEQLAELCASLADRRVQPIAEGTMVALRFGETPLGFIYLAGHVVEERDRELLAVFANQAAVAIQNASLYELAAIDQLTRAYTRRFFDQALMRELRLAYRNGTPLSVVMVDVDDMKRLNDGGGHLAGDQALATVGSVLRQATRTTDIVGRYGGDEFAVVLPGTDAVGAEVVMRRIAEAASALSVSGHDGAEHALRITLGGAALACATGEHRSQSEAFFAATAKRLIAAADAGMYRGKQSGKACATSPSIEPWPIDESEAA